MFDELPGHDTRKNGKNHSLTVVARNRPSQLSAMRFLLLTICAAGLLWGQSGQDLNNLGVDFGKQGRPADAESMFRRAIASDSGCRQAYSNLALLLFSQNRIEEAANTLNTGLQLHADVALLWTVQAMVESKLGHDPTESFRKAVALEPGSVDFRANLGIALVQWSRSDEAMHELEIALRLAPARLEIMAWLGVAEEGIGDLQRAEGHFRKVIAQQPANKDARFFLGRCLERTGRRDAAIAEWRNVLNMDPDHAQALYALQRVLRKSDPGAASEYLARFAALKQNEQRTALVDGLQIAGWTAARSGNWPKAIAKLQEALSTCGDCRDRAALHRMLGLVYADSGDVTTARRELASALQLNATDATARAAMEKLKSQPILALK